MKGYEYAPRSVKWTRQGGFKVVLGEPFLKVRLSTVDLLVLTSSDLLLLILKTFLTFFAKQATLMRRSTVLSLPLQQVFPGHTFHIMS